jgi:hypothetical protein
MNRSRYLDSLEPIVVKPAVACAIGLNHAIIVQQLEYWVERYRFDPEHQHEGCTWVFNSYEDWQENNFPFWSVDTVKRLFQDLEKQGIIVAGRFNRKNYDRTKWYRIEYALLDREIEKSIEARDASQARKAEEIAPAEEPPEVRPSGENARSMGATCPDGRGQNAPMHGGNLHRPIPETTRDYSEMSEGTRDRRANLHDGRRKPGRRQLPLTPSRDRPPPSLEKRIADMWEHLRKLPHPERSASLPRLRELLATDQGRKIAHRLGVDLSGLLVNRSA